MFARNPNVQRWPFQPLGLIATVVVASGCGILVGDQSTAGEEKPTPLAAFLGEPEDPLLAGGNSVADLNAMVFQESMDRELAISTCMAKEGFEYVAYVPPSTTAFNFRDEVGVDPGTREWAERYGFGLTTFAFPQSRVGDGLVGYDDRSVLESFRSNPNDAIVQALSDAEFDKYSQALHGDLPVAIEDDDQTAVAGFAEPGGCVGEALTDPDIAATTRFRVAFAEEIDDLYERVTTDARVVSFYEELRTCVELEGYDFVEPADLVQESHPWRDDLEALQAEAGAIDPLADVDLAQVEAMSETQLDAFIAEQIEASELGSKLTPELLGRLENLQAEETGLAVAIFDCGGAGETEARLRRDVLADLQTAFIAENEERLTEFRDQALD